MCIDTPNHQPGDRDRHAPAAAQKICMPSDPGDRRAMHSPGAVTVQSLGSCTVETASVA